MAQSISMKRGQGRKKMTSNGLNRKKSAKANTRLKKIPSKAALKKICEDWDHVT